MNNLVFPPSPSWYLSNIIACNNNGTIAYGSRHEVILIKVQAGIEVSPHSLEYDFIPVAHKERITSLVFAPSNASDCFKNCLVTASDDGSVRLWDVGSLELKMINSGLKETQKIVGADWSYSDPNVVVSVSDLATVYCWDLPSNKLRKINLGPKIYPLCLSICPHDKNLIAVGAKGGIVLIVSLKGEGSIKYRMRSHDSDVISLSWCPVQYNIFQADDKLKAKDNSKSNSDQQLKDQETKNSNLQNGRAGSDFSESQAEKSVAKKTEFLLASGGKDRSIYFWRAGTDGRYETFINFPQQPVLSGYRSKMVGEKGGSNIWGCVRWVSPYTLLSGSQFGELLSWDLSSLKTNKTEKDKKSLPVNKPKLLHGNHSKGVFSISCPIESSQFKEDKRLIWTTSLDRKLIACSLKTGDVVAELSTIGGIVFCLAISTLDPNRIAIGVGDGKILIWNMGCSSKLDVSVHWQKINSKVMALDWHPTEENWLAFATREGRVGLLDVNSNKPPLIFRQHHHRSVYRLLWAPHIKQKDSSHTGKYEFALYSVGDGEVVQYSVNTYENEPVLLNDIFKKADESSKIDKTPWRTEFNLNHDRSLISVGNDNGIIYILDGKTLKKCSVLMAFKKIVQCLTWHPASVTSDPSGLSACCNWLAAASDCVKVFNIGSDGKTFETVATLSLQSEKIVDISWSPHLNGHLVSASYDYTAQVWDVIKQTPLVSYCKHHNAVLCAVWSPLSPDFIISGSSDSTLRVWKLSEQVDARPSDKKKNRVSNFLKRVTAAAEATCTQDSQQTNQRRHLSSSSVSSVKNSSSKNEVDVDVNPVAEWEAGQFKRAKSKSLFPVHSAALNVSKHINEYFERWKVNKSVREDNSEKISNSGISKANGESSLNGEPATAVLPPESEKELAYFDFFGDRKAMRRLLKVEENQLREEKQHANANYCSLWRGDITELIKDAMNKKSLDNWLMSLAPMASYRVWQEACVVYSEQLANQGNFINAASYLLAVHKVEEALELLCEHKLFREAIALAKCRLPSDDPIIRNVVLKYAEYAVSTGMFNLAAHWYVSINDPLSASQTLSRCKDLKSLKMAALLAREANAVEIADSLAKEAFCSSLMAGDFDSCSEILSHHSNLEFLKIWIKTNKIVNENRKLSLPCLATWLQGGGIGIEPILDVIKGHVESISGCYDKLKSNVNCFNALDTEKQLWLFISSHFSLAGAADSRAITLYHLVQCLAAASKFQTLNNRNDILIHICAMISPKGPNAEESMFKLQSDCLEESNLLSSLHGFLLAGIISWLNDHVDAVKHFDIIQELPSSEVKNKDSAFNWIGSVIDLCQADLFDRRNIEYFKNETMIKNLEFKIAASRCNAASDKQEQRVLLMAVRTKNRKGKKELDSSKQSCDVVSNRPTVKDSCVKVVDEKVIDNAVINDMEDDEEGTVLVDKDNVNKNAVISDKSCISKSRINVDTVTEDLDLASRSLDNSLSLIEEKNSIKEISLPVEDIVDNGSIPTLDVRKSQSDELGNGAANPKLETKLSVRVVTGDDGKKNIPSSQSLVIELNNDDNDAKSLQKLNAVKLKFEAEKVSTPNPFIVYCQLQNVLTLLLKEDCPEQFKTICSKIQHSWENAKV